jgi:putative flavoprotein involved in K+ transport
MSHTTDVIIVGAGQAGLAMSRCLATMGVSHVLLERGRVAERWRSERWNSLRLLTPNWMTRLPGFAYEGPDPNGFMRSGEVAAFLGTYASRFAAPVVANAEVLELSRRNGVFDLITTQGHWRCRAVVIATGHCDRPAVPSCAADLPGSIVQLTPTDYRLPNDLPTGGVLVVGASATGVQLADELHRSGRPVTLAVGRHTRLPRRYRGRDIMTWLDRAGILDEPRPDHVSPAAAYRQNSLQLVGSAEGRNVDIATLQASGIRVTGRLTGVAGSRVTFGPDLPEHVARAQARLERLLARIDDFIARETEGAPPSEPLPAIAVERGPDEIDLEGAGIRSVLWATGFRRDYRWLDIPVLGADGEIVHQGGVTACPGLFALGMPFQSRRKSTFIDGVGGDAAALAFIVRDGLLSSRHAA